MPRRVTLAFVAVLVAGLLVVAVEGAIQRRIDQQRNGVFAAIPVAVLAPGHVACETQIGLADPVSRIGFDTASNARPTPAVNVWVRDHGTRRVLARGLLKARWVPGAQVVLTRAVYSERLVDICFRDAGPGRVQLLGDVPGRFVTAVATSNRLLVDGKPAPGAIAVRFVRDHPTRLLKLVPDMLRHAAVLRPVGAWALWLLLVAVVVGVPLAVWRGVRSAVSDG